MRFENVESLESLGDSKFAQGLFNMLAEGTNLTEAVGVGSAVADLMQVNYEEIMEGQGASVASLTFVVLVLIGGLMVYCCYKWVDVDHGPTPLTAHEKAIKAGKKNPFMMWLYKKKFGKDQGPVMEKCMTQISDKAPSLLHNAGFDLKELKEEFDDMKKNKKPRRTFKKSELWLWQWNPMEFV